MVHIQVSCIKMGGKTFDTLDYICFASVFVLSFIVGIYHAFKDRKATQSDNYHFGDRKMPVIPVSFSLTVTFMSSLSIIGTPAEIYMNGTMMLWMIPSFILSSAGAAYIFIPVFYRLRLTSCFEYLELRFDKTVRRMASLVYVIQTILYLGIVSYIPALVLEVVTGIPLMTSIVGTVVVCTLYTALGGMKAVLWTDTIQFIIIISGLLCAIVKGALEVGGIANAWDIAYKGGRVILSDISGDPIQRHTVWNIMIGGSIRWMYLYGVNQAEVQRACSTPTLRKAKLSLGINSICLTILWLLIVMVGIVMFAFYSQCDPVASGLISSPNQLLPLFILDILGNSYGLSGIFVACVFSGCLSTVSSGLNALSAVLVEDFIKPFYTNRCNFLRNDVTISKLLVVLSGCMVLGTAIFTSYVKGLILEVAITLVAVTAGPLLGLYLSGMMLPWTNKIGAMSGLICSIMLVGSIVIGAKVNNIKTMFPLPVSTIDCPSDGNLTNITTFVSTGINWTIVSNVSTAETYNQYANLHSSGKSVSYSGSENETYLTSPLPTRPNSSSTLPTSLTWFYSISYMWYAVIGTVTHLLIATLVSFLSGYAKSDDTDQDLLSDMLHSRCFSKTSDTRKVLHSNKDESNRKSTASTAGRAKVQVDKLILDNSDADDDVEAMPLTDVQSRGGNE